MANSANKTNADIYKFKDGTEIHIGKLNREDLEFLQDVEDCSRVPEILKTKSSSVHFSREVDLDLEYRQVIGSSNSIPRTSDYLFTQEADDQVREALFDKLVKGMPKAPEI